MIIENVSLEYLLVSEFFITLVTLKPFPLITVSGAIVDKKATRRRILLAAFFTGKGFFIQMDDFNVFLLISNSKEFLVTSIAGKRFFFVMLADHMDLKAMGRRKTSLE